MTQHKSTAHSNDTRRAALRQLMRQRRRAIPEAERLAASTQLLTQVLHCLNVEADARIAVYWPNDGEISPEAIIHHARATRAHTYLPVVGDAPDNLLHFALYTDDTPLKKNQFGIYEPDSHSALITAQALDSVLVPIVAFDAQGHRLGMGGGYYDRSFAFLRGDSATPPHKPSPQLIGIAFEQQKVDAVPVEHWDIPLHAIATEVAVYKKS